MTAGHTRFCHQTSAVQPILGCAVTQGRLYFKGFVEQLVLRSLFLS